MKNEQLPFAAVVALCSILGIGTGIARADVTIQRSTAVEGVGAMAFGNMTGTSTTVISGNRSRTDSDMKMQSKLIGFLARGAVGPTAEIVSLDEDRIDHLNLIKKEYTETTFEQLRAQMQKATDQMDQQQQQQGRQPSAVDQSKCEWLPAKVSVNRTGESSQFAGYDAERAIITAVQPCQDKETGSICDVVLVLDQWLSPGLTESAEVRRYYQAYAAKMGLDAAGMQDASQRAKALFSQYKGLWSEVATKMQGVKGYPVKTGFTLAMGGAQCKDPKAQQAQSGQSGDSSGGSDTPTNPGALAGALAGKLGGLFHKKQDDAAAAPAAPPVPLPPGDVALMTVTSQLVSMSNSGVSADVFTVPADFKRTELRTQ
jgi:hypothetical protein